MSRTTLLKSEVHRGFLVEVHYDECPAINPRVDFDHFTHLVMSHRRYSLPNDIDMNFDDYEGWEDVERHVREEYDVVGFAWVIGYDHGSLIARMQEDRKLPDPWDSGVLGFVFMTREQQEAAGTPDDLISTLMKGEVDEYNSWATGDVYGFIVREWDAENEEAGDEVEDGSCWGFIGEPDYCMEQGKDIANWHADRVETEAAAANLPITVNE